jgi:hypothetical protein
MNDPQPDIAPADLAEWKERNKRWTDSQRKRANALRIVQRTWELSDYEMSRPIALLDRMRVDRTQTLTIEKFGVVKSSAEQIQDCVNLQNAASVISRQFQFFKQFLEVDFALKTSFGEISDLAAKGTSQAQIQRKWGTLRQRFLDDAELLGRLAKAAAQRIEKQCEVPGKPSENWRDESFQRLFVLLGHVFSGSKAKRTKLALDIWNIYFTEEFYLTEEVVEKFLKKT